MSSALPLLLADAAERYGGMSIDAWCNVAYLVASVLFIVGLKGLSHPEHAVRGNWIAALGMALAIGATLWKLHSFGRMPLFYAVLGGIALGSFVGWILAVRARMTAVPQLVALLNSFGGLASVLVAGAAVATTLHPTLQDIIAIALAGLLGAIAFTGSGLAYARLQDHAFLRKLSSLPGKHAVRVACGLVAIGLSVWLVVKSQQSDHPEQYDYIYTILCIVSVLLGIGLVLPIAAADMPVVIALLNSCSGLAAAAIGFVIDNDMLIVAGALVGASGVTIAQMICKTMNRSLASVLFGLVESESAGRP